MAVALLLLIIVSACDLTPKPTPSADTPEAAQTPIAPPEVARLPAPAPESASTNETGTIEGRVVDAVTEAPLGDFEVAHPADKDAQGRPVFVATSEPDGRFFLGGLEPGPAEVLIRAKGYANASCRVSVPDTINTPAEVVARLERARTIEGTVEDASGHPVEGVSIFVGEIPFPFLEGREAGRSDAQGHFRTEGVPPRPVPICAYHPDYAVTSAPAEGAMRMTLAPGNRVEGVLRAEGEPLVNAEVRAEAPESNGLAVSGYTDNEGRFSLAALPTGPMEFTVNWSDTRRAIRRIETKAGETVRMDIDFPPATTRLEGRVTQHGILVQYAELEVRVSGDSGEEFTTIAKTSAEGWYRTDPAPPGKARLFVMAVTADSRMRRKVVETAVPGGESVRQDIDFKEGATLQGELQGLEADEHARVYVLWSALERRPMNRAQLEELTKNAVARQFLRQNGALRMDSLEPGRYTLFAIALREETPEDFAQARTAATEVTVGRKDAKPARLAFE